MLNKFISRVFGQLSTRSIGSSQTIAQASQRGMEDLGRPQMPEFDHKPTKYTGPSYDEMLKMRKDHVHPASFLLYKRPLLINEGRMQYLYDHTGRRYLDLFAGVSTCGMGHCHPRITAKIQEQVKKLQHATPIYLGEEHCLYAKELAAKLPEGMDVIYFLSSGSEANAFATQMARSYTGNYPIITLRNGYHGMYGTQHLSAVPSWNHNIPKTQGVEHASFPDLYRGPFPAEAGDIQAEQAAAQWHANDVKDVIDFHTAGKVALYMAEPVQGAGGLVPMPKDYVNKAVEHVKNAGGLYLSDEVQTGFGRIGSHYWGFERLGTKPDIVTMAKQVANGFPVSVVATTKEIAENCMNGKTIFATYGGNPIGMAAGREVLKVIDDERLVENSHAMGELFFKNLRDIQSRVPTLGDVRGAGLMIGLELVQDKATKTPADQEYFNAVFEKTKDYGILLGKGGRHGNVIRLQPPMCLNAQDVEFACDVIERSLKECM